MTTAVDRVKVLQSQLDADLPAERLYSAGDLWHNWAHVHGDCRPLAHHYPTSIEEVAAVVKLSQSQRRSLRVAGGGWSPNACTYTSGHLLHTSKLRQIVSVDSKSRLVTAQAGVTLRELAANIAAKGMALPVIPSILDPTLGGAISNAAHSTGFDTRSFSAAVRAMKVVDGLGQVHTINQATPIPQSVAARLSAGAEKRRLLDAFACSLGALGVIVEVTFEADRLGTIQFVEQPVPLAEIRARADQRATMNEFYRFAYVPHTDMCVEAVGKRVAAPDEDAASSVALTAKTSATTPGKAPAADLGKKLSRVTHLLGSPATQGADQRHWVEEQQSALFNAAKTVKGPWLKHDVTENALALACAVPRMQPSVNQMFQRTFLNEKQEQFGPAHQVLPMDCLIRQHTIEFAFEASRWREVLDATIAAVARDGLHVHWPIEVRFTDGESTWMAPNHGRKTCYVGLVMHKPKGRDPPDLQRYFATFEKLATAMGGRPHWAKTFTWGPKQFAAAYPCHGAFTELARLMDPDRVFANDWVKRVTGV